MFCAASGSVHRDELILVSVTEVQSSTITIPESIKAGDVAILIDCVGTGSGNPAYVVPTGFTEISRTSAASSSVKVLLSWKLLVQVDAGSTITGMNGGTHRGKILYVIRKINNPCYKATISPINFENTAGDPISQTLSNVQPTSVIYGGIFGYGGASGFASFTNNVSQIGDGSGRLRAGIALGNDFVSTYTIDSADTGSANGLWSFSILME